MRIPTLFFISLIMAGFIHSNGIAYGKPLSLQEAKSELIAVYGIELSSEKPDAPWTRDNGIILLNLLTSLPNELSKIALESGRATPVRFLISENSTGKPPVIFRYKGNTGSYVIVKGDKINNQDDISRQVLYFLLHLYDNHHRVSQDPRWMKISGWRYKTLAGVKIPFLGPNAQNQDPRGYADINGLKNPSEDFVLTGLNYFLPRSTTVEACIKCRIPQKYDFLGDLFPGTASPLAAPEITCRKIDSGFTDDLMFFNPDNGEKVEIGPVNTRTVTGFELLYATPGIGDASEIAGHLVLRIKLDNNPDAKKNGMENPHDLVISFLADTGPQTTPAHEPVIRESCKKNWFNLVDNQQGESALESITQSLKGLSGGFLTSMDRQTLAHAIKSYTIEQDRDLLRFRLNLTDTQKDALLERLYLSKKNYKARYYFFDQNCASVLIRVLGQGIGDAEVAGFNPMVSPPNTLTGLLIRKGLAKPVYPSFYSYRKKGYIAQEIMKHEYETLTSRFPESDWPKLNDYLSKREFIRSEAILQTLDIITDRPLMYESVYRFASIAQEAEMVFSHKDLLCEDYTSIVTADIRELQRYILHESDLPMNALRLNTDASIRNAFQETEKTNFTNGTPHTGHYTWSFGTGFYQSDLSADTPVVQLRGVLHHQEMGSVSNIAMQRAGYVELGKISATVSNKSHENRLKKWQATGLRIRKFKDRLGRVPDFSTPFSNVGIGLSLLDFKGVDEEDSVICSLAGGEILYNFFSSEENSNFLFLSVGSELKSWYINGMDNLGVTFPLTAESLLSWNKKRKWQWRNRAEYHLSSKRKNGDELLLSSTVSYLLGNIKSHQATLKFSYQFEKEYADAFFDADRERKTSLVEIEINRW